jgi:hypothetical protein
VLRVSVPVADQRTVAYFPDIDALVDRPIPEKVQAYVRAQVLQRAYQAILDDLLEDVDGE